MNITKINIDGKEYIIKDKEAQKAVEELKSKLEAVELQLQNVGKLHIIEVE